MAIKLDATRRSSRDRSARSDPAANRCTFPAASKFIRLPLNQAPRGDLGAKPHAGRPPDADGLNCAISRRDRLAEILIARQRMLPRQVLPRQFYLITRRCSQRQFLLRPDVATNNAFLYCLIDAALRATESLEKSSDPIGT